MTPPKPVRWQRTTGRPSAPNPLRKLSALALPIALSLWAASCGYLPTPTPTTTGSHLAADLTAQATNRAFPTAQGFGANTPGGRGGKVLVITDLSDSGKPGTLRHAVESVKGPRTIVFGKSGYITLEDTLVIKEPFLTIAGHSAPGKGITIRGAKVAIETHDVIMRYLRFRMGNTTGLIGKCDPDKTDCTFDTMTLDGAQRVLIDHCSFSFSIDEILSGVDSQDVTIQHSIISDPLDEPRTKDGEYLHNEAHSHAYCSLFRGSTNVSFHHNLYANCEQRTPQVSPKGKYPPKAFIANNFIYNYGKKATKWNNSTGGSSKTPHTDLAIINNFYEVLTKNPPYAIQIETSDRLTISAYVSGNIGPYRSSDQDDDWDIVYIDGNDFGMDEIRVNKPFADPGIAITPVGQVKNMVMAQAGASFPARDAIDESLIADISKRRGRVVNSEDDWGGFPNLPELEAPRDSDRDGIPDAWEQNHGLNPEKDDSQGKAFHNHYTNLEIYLESLLDGTSPPSSGSTDPTDPSPEPTPEPTPEPEPAPAPQQPGVITVAVSSGDADGHQFKKEAMDLNGNTIDLGAKYSALRFALTLPQGAKVVAAHLEVTAAEDTDRKLSLKIRRSDFNGSFSDLDDLKDMDTSGKVKWKVRDWQQGLSYLSPDITELVRDFQDSGESQLTLQIKGKKGGQLIHSFEGNQQLAPRLIVRFE